MSWLLLCEGCGGGTKGMGECVINSTPPPHPVDFLVLIVLILVVLLYIYFMLNWAGALERQKGGRKMNIKASINWFMARKWFGMYLWVTGLLFLSISFYPGLLNNKLLEFCIFMVGIFLILEGMTR